MSAAVRAAPEREFAFSPEDHRAVAALAYSEAGIVLAEGKAQLVYGRLAPRVRQCGLRSVSDYLELLKDDAEERAAAIDALTTNHTSFFRENHHFEDFTRDRWPALAKRLMGGGRVRLWSAACSSGEEPYSLLMAALGTEREKAATLLRTDLRLLATDLSPSVLNAARAGRYSNATLSTVPAGLRHAWTKRDADGEHATIDPAMRAAIAFRPLNLLRAWPMKGRFDTIFCRNVMIYFDGPTKDRLQTRLSDQLVEGGMLYIGHSERLAGELTQRFRQVGKNAFLKVTA
jgi:chemotaxis protein methyltransferase CheR